jgi:hypothetical protein
MEDYIPGWIRYQYREVLARLEAEEEQAIARAMCCGGTRTGFTKKYGRADETHVAQRRRVCNERDSIRRR